MSEGGVQPAAAAAPSMTPEEMGELLMQAAFLLSTSRLVAPADGNAIDIFKRVLAAEPGNRVALTGMISIGNVYERAAADMLQEDRPGVSARIVDRGLDAVPDHPGLLQLKARLRTGAQ